MFGPSSLLVLWRLQMILGTRASGSFLYLHHFTDVPACRGVISLNEALSYADNLSKLCRIRYCRYLRLFDKRLLCTRQRCGCGIDRCLRGGICACTCFALASASEYTAQLAWVQSGSLSVSAEAIALSSAPVSIVGPGALTSTVTLLLETIVATEPLV